MFHSGQGAQGYLLRPSKLELEATFGTSTESEVLDIILEKGKMQTSEHPIKIQGGKNASQ